MTIDRQADLIGDGWTAEEWLIALADSPDDADLRAGLARWLDSDPQNLSDWKTAVRTYRSLGALKVSAAPATPVPIRRRFSRRLSRRAAACAAVAAAACLILMLGPSLLRGLQSDFSSGTGEIRRIELGDGSIVRLAPESAVAVEFRPDSRRVDLVDGIALFDVAPDPDRPFSVTAASARATAIGTSFEVRRTIGGDGVAVREGVVAVDVVTDGVGPARLEAGQGLILAPARPPRPRTVLPEQVGLWAEGLVTARDRPVGDLVDEIRRYFAGLIVVHGDAFASQPVTGIYDVGDPEAALKLIAASQGADFYRLSPWVVVLIGD